MFNVKVSIAQVIFVLERTEVVNLIIARNGAEFELLLVIAN